MARKCDLKMSHFLAISANAPQTTGEDEWIRDILINNMKNSDIQRKLNVALIDEKGILNHLKLTNNFKSKGIIRTQSF